MLAVARERRQWQEERERVVIIIMGVSGSGKTTVGQALAHAVEGAFHDADQFHSEANVEKMRSGIRLTDADRKPWLEALRRMIDEWLTQRAIHVLACSALTSRSRRCLRADREDVRLVYLCGDAALIEARMRERDHFMPAELLSSQLEELEPPTDALVLNIERPVEDLVDQIRSTWNI